MSSCRVVCAIVLTCLVCALSAASDDWWEQATIYQIYPRSFQDSDGDGVGDLNGITSRLEYLKEIGITATWLSPIFESPMVDFGYDISNFTRIDPLFGSLADFEALLAKAKALDIKVLLDFVPNHSSDKCLWFQKSVRREDGYDDFYVWADGRVDPSDARKRLPPSNWVSVNGGSMWTWHPHRQQYYLHQFLPQQPDLNFNSPKARAHMLAVLEYWLDRGVAGFRIDAVPHMLEAQHPDGSYPDEPKGDGNAAPDDYGYHNHIYTKDQPGTVELMYEWREFLERYQSEHGGDTRVMLAEAYSPVEQLSAYFGNATHRGAQVPMNFQLMYLNAYSTAVDVEHAIDYWMNIMWSRHQVANWVIGNHDNVRVVNRIGAQKADALNIIVNTLPGASVTYYGEELGMSNGPTKCTEISCDSRDPERTPMQWTPKSNAGFSTAQYTWLPLALDYQRINAQTERGVARSSLNIFKALQALKHTSAFKALKLAGGFSYKALTTRVLQIIRTNTKSEEYRVLVNMGNEVEKLTDLADKVMECVITTAYSRHNYGDKIDLSGTVLLMPYEGIVLRWRSY